MMLRTLAAVGLFVVMTIAAACDSGPVTATTVTTTNGSTALAVFAGVWTSTTPVDSQAACRDVKYSVTPTGATTATVAYSATCAGQAISGTGSGILSGSTFNWTTNGTATPCTFSLAGTAIQVVNGIRLDYTGQVCGVPVSGSDVLHQ
jgi:hypothetical protein